MKPPGDGPLPPLETLAERMTYARRSLGWTRAQLQSALRERGVRGASVMTIRRSESGARSPSVVELLALADLSGLPATWLLDGTATGDAPTLARERAWILGTLRAARVRHAEAGSALEPLAAAQARLESAREAGQLSEEAWRYWIAVREAVLLLTGGPPESS